ncbi:DUF4123 domain-containing protein [Ramlibacter sp. XY19]|uniref:DUF4123 domain-containing protein n=1 Tax=Ramlibacter paludis TaxID=2908000 RepID=UPI0023DCE999|nr:DUF4123 domain-containing protein [Ramlibacter paludis]MCG2595104.1 DUF4123 domain-containing protein [Ramlibacter paludis]
MASFGEIWTGLKQAGGGTPYLLVDCAGLDAGAAALPRGACTELECLFTGDLADELADVAPYLGRVKAFEGEVPGVAEDLLKRQVGMLVVVPPAPDGEAPTFSQLHRHFRKFNVVYDPEGKPLFFRYYDPRVIVEVLSVLEPQQLDAFFGPIDSLVLVDGEARTVRCYRQGGKLAVQG